MLSPNTVAQKPNRWALLPRYHAKPSGKLLFLAVITGVAVVIWAIVTKTDLTRDGLGVGVPAFVWIWGEHFRFDRYSTSAVLFLMAVLLAGDGVGIWAIFRFTSLPHGEQVSIAVGMGAGLPILFSLWIFLLCDKWAKISLFDFLFLSLLYAVLAPIIWAIATKANLQLNVKVSLGVGLAVGLTYFCVFIFVGERRSMQMPKEY
jgi:hypothetical protein